VISIVPSSSTARRLSSRLPDLRMRHERAEWP
jgi:hypothetical protein